MRGTVKWFSSTKGFGFIVPDGWARNSRDLFVHYTALEMDGYKEVSQGDRVEFDIEETEKGPQATHVRVLPKPSKTGRSGPRKPSGGRGGAP